MKYKHEHGSRNKVIQQEERSMLADVDRALASSPNSQTIGRNGEIPLLHFFNRYLPPTFKAISGHFITPNGNISPQIDVMILDSRYPFLSQNLDGSVLAMLHSVIQTIEVKTNITTNDIKGISIATSKIQSLIAEVDIFSKLGDWKSPCTKTIAYRCQNKLETLENAYKKYFEPNEYYNDITILRLPEKDQPQDKEAGCELNYEPLSETDIEEMKEKFDVPDSEFKDRNFFGTRASYTPLADFYYQLVQNGYYTLGEREFSFNDLGKHVMDYMSWSTASWGDIY